MGSMNWLAIGAGLLCLSGASQAPRDPLPGWPRLMLWAWERPENLEFLDPHSAGVAYLAGTITWRDDGVTFHPRLQPLRVSLGTRIVAVVRLESRGELPATAQVVGQILRAVSSPAGEAVQIDFDARQSERQWYAALLRAVRERLPAHIPLTITALASWCQSDRWLQDLPVQDAVPMLFRMGSNEPRQVRAFQTPPCDGSWGIATDEMPSALPRGRRIFVFSPRPWDEGSYRAMVRLVARSQ